MGDPDQLSKKLNLGRTSRHTIHRTFSFEGQLFFKRMWSLLRQPLFISITAVGNCVVLGSASLLYYLEFGKNPHITSFLDCVWWAVSTVTTVGYGDVIPMTQIGRVMGILTMIFGITLFWSYTALFAEALLTREILDLEDELQGIEIRLAQLQKSNMKSKEKSLEMIDQLEKKIQSLKENVDLGRSDKGVKT
jgi:hypothetical protein